MLTRGLDRSLFLYPLQEWKAIEEKMKTLSTTQADARAFVRLFFPEQLNANRTSRDGSPSPLISGSMPGFKGISTS